MGRAITVADVMDGVDGLLVSSSGSSDVTFEQGSIDSRVARAGDLFFALQGERNDGHDFVSQAISGGASGAVIERPMDLPGDRRAFHVSSSLDALQRLARWWRQRHEIPVVGVTGSVGKTTAKELIASVLSRKHTVLKSPANLNTEIGIPLTLLQLREEHSMAVLEMAMYQRGDIALLASIASPQTGVVMNVGPVHLERIGYFGGIVAAKAELVEALPAGGLAVLNGDDARVAAFSARTRARVVKFGTSGDCQVRAEEVRARGLDGISFRLHTAAGTADIHCPLPGKHHVYPALAAAAVALNEGVTLDEIRDALADAVSDLRLARREGPNGSTIIDDSYNASPAAMLAALDLLGGLDGRRIALLGGMRELGAATAEGNRQVGRQAAAQCDILYVVGDEARGIGIAAEKAGLRNVHYVESPEEASEALETVLREGDYLLVKASRAIGLESVVGALVVR
jgi:UDP-N-acetylmuramoyl-tripeptide--D-alanyl-D-alanine ligase